jgi:exopolyphosphatase/guanosine-5'-triphosphate,3'-diphosphate pyrophosphatase
VAITEAIFDVLNIEVMRTSKGALREGVIYDLVGRLRHEDVRERSVNAMMQRYAVDEETAALVARRTELLFAACAADWQLSAADGELLQRAARMHEIGMAISHKHFHRHGAYLLRNSDMPGFSQGEQEHLALLVACQRGKLRREAFAELGSSELARLQRMVAIMRLAVLFKYVEQLETLPELHMRASGDTLILSLSQEWLQRHPLTWQELQSEQRSFGKLELKLEINTSS